MRVGKRRIGSTVSAVAIGFAVFTGVALAVSGSLTFVEQDKEGVAGVGGLNGAIDVAVSPNGASVYAVGTGSNAVATFSRDPGTGALTFVEQDVDGASGVDGIGGARGVTVSPNGATVYVTGHSDGAVATFSRDPGTGALSFVEQDKDGVGGVDGIAGAWGVSVSPDGAHVYVAGDADSAVATFSRDPGTGALSFVEQDKDGVGGVDGLGTATGVAVSPGTGANVYVASCGDSAVVTFSRDPGTGALTFVEQEKQGVAGVDGLACARGVAIDGGGSNVYVAAESGDDVATFSRDPGTGALSFVEQDKDGVGGVDGLNGARDVATSPDCGHVYVASAVDDAVVTLSRDAGTGALSFVEQDKDGVAGVDGIDQSVGVTASPNSASVYVTGEFDDAVATFSREASGSSCAGSAPGPGGGSGPAARTITLAASKSKLKKGKKVTLSGDLSAPADVAGCESGQTVELQRKGKRDRSFTTRSQLTTDAAGRFSSKQKVKKTADYRAVVAATSTCAAAESAAKKVKVKKRKKRRR